jgi:hypothetical protein
MDVKITHEKLNKLRDIVIDFLNVDTSSFQSRMGSKFLYIQFLTPGTRANVIARMYPDLKLIVLNDEKFYNLISVWVGSHKLYDIIKDELIKQIYQKYTNNYKRLRDTEIRNVKYMSDKQFNEK